MKISNLFCGGDWIVLYKEKDCRRYTPLKGQKGYWYADPFLFEYDGVLYLFTEAFNKLRQVGELAVSIYNEQDKEFSCPRVIIRNRYHMSYPCAFSYGGKVFMVPETGENKDLELYEFLDFPFKYQKHILKDNVVYADSTAFVFGGHIYLICYDDAANESHLFQMDSNSYSLHKITSKKHSSKYFRPAGNLFFAENNKLCRPTQDCEVSYGGGTIINEFDDFFKLDEHIVSKHYPNEIDGGYTKMHTFNSVKNLEVVDVFKRRYGLSCFFEKIIRRIHKVGIQSKSKKK